ncbi:MAG UNVERIFIED_CONTAM: hypothetical protein LVQ98_03625 [Rickettsiaceae bacterium]|jgi:hypothetical protein
MSLQAQAIQTARIDNNVATSAVAGAGLPTTIAPTPAMQNAAIDSNIATLAPKGTALDTTIAPAQAIQNTAIDHTIRLQHPIRIIHILQRYSSDSQASDKQPPSSAGPGGGGGGGGSPDTPSAKYEMKPYAASSLSALTSVITARLDLRMMAVGVGAGDKIIQKGSLVQSYA